MIGAMLDTLVPRCAHMLSEEGPHMPNFAETLVGNVQQDSSHSPDLGKIPTAALHTTTIQAFPTLRHMLLDTDPASRLVFTDVLCHSLGAPQRLASEELGADSLDKDELMEAGYDACVGALTIIRLWMVCKEEYRPVHLKTTGASQDTLAESIVVYIEHVHKLTKWLIDMNCWDIKKVPHSGWCPSWRPKWCSTAY
ncbi:hypothetical protein H4R19_000065 [Coemansia spiralis]|nr:hypothetical protein H4R19_000065 [Coemansia spiralis]